MAGTTIEVTNLGQYGYQPDVSPTNLPPNAFTYSRNFLFNEGNYAEVADGYTNALDTRVKTTIGTASTDATFLYTWLLSNNNAFFYYDANINKMMFVEANTDEETDTDSSLIEYDMTLRDVWTLESEFDSDTDQVVTSGMFQISSDHTKLYIHYDSDNKATIDAALVSGSMFQIRKGALTDDTGRRTEIFKIDIDSANVVFDTENDVVTVPLDTEIPNVDSDFTGGTTYTLAAFSEFDLSPKNNYVWEAVDALGIPVFNNEDEEPWRFVDDYIPYLQMLDNWPNGGTCKSMASFSSFLVAVGYQNSSAAAGYKGNTRTLAISGVITEAGTLPNWDFEGADSYAQIIDLSLYTDGDLVSAYEANGQLILNSTTDVMVLTYQGEGEFSATKLPMGTGVLTKRSSVAIPNGYFNIGNGVFYTHDGNSYQEVGDGIFRDTWFNAVDTARLDEVQMVYDPRTRNVKIKTPTSTVAQEIWVYNLDTNTIGIQDDHQEIAYMTWSAEGIPAIDATWNTFSEDLTWDTIPQNSWSEFPVISLGEYRNRVLSVGGNELFVHDFGSSYNGRDIDAVLERSLIRLKQNTYGQYQISRVIPWIDEAPEENALVGIRIGFAATPDRATVWTPYSNFEVGEDEKLDFRRSGKWGAISFRCTVSGTKISGYELEITRSNKR